MDKLSTERTNEGTIYKYCAKIKYNIADVEYSLLKHHFYKVQEYIGNVMYG